MKLIWITATRTSSGSQLQGPTIHVKTADDPLILSDDDELVSAGGPLILSPQLKNHATAPVKVFKAVEVPHQTSVKVRRTQRKTSGQSPETVSLSSRSSHRDFSHEYETPATSVAVTPAERITDMPGKLSYSKSLPLRSVSARNRLESSFDNIKGKRKRTYLDDELEADQRLAEALQAEEYRGVTQPVESSRRKFQVLDSDEDETSLTDPPSDMDLDSSSRDESIIIDRRAVKKIRTNATSYLPARRARDKARTSIAQKASLGIMDSDEEEDEVESEYTSEADSDVLSDVDSLEEALDHVMDSNDIQTAATITAAPNTLPAASNIRVPMAGRRRGHRDDMWETRVFLLAVQAC